MEKIYQRTLTHRDASQYLFVYDCMSLRVGCWQTNDKQTDVVQNFIERTTTTSRVHVDSRVHKEKRKLKQHSLSHIRSISQRLNSKRRRRKMVHYNFAHTHIHSLTCYDFPFVDWKQNNMAKITYNLFSMTQWMIWLNI